MQKSHLITILIIAAVVIAGGSFFAGTKVGQGNKTFVGPNGKFGQGNMQQGTNTLPKNSSMMSGEIISKDATTITVKTQNGSTKIILYSGSTEVSKSTLGTAEDLAVGTNVRISGTSSSDGTVTAKTIQVLPHNFASNSQQNQPPQQ